MLLALYLFTNFGNNNSGSVESGMYKTDLSSYDLVISDIRKPEINGFQLYHKLKAINKDVKVLFATCPEIAEEILTLMPQLTKEQLIQKPIERERFIEIVKKGIV